MNKTTLNIALAAALSLAATVTQAATVHYVDQLTIYGDVSNNCGYVCFGSYFGMDLNGNGKISESEKTALATGTSGIIIGSTTTAGASHPGAPTVGDTNAIDAPWGFFGNTGSDYNTVAITGSTTAGLNMSGWTVTWSGIASIPMGSGAWATVTGTGSTGATGTFTDGVGNFAWDGVYGHNYTLNYHATVPVGNPSGFGGVKYELHLEGIVNQPAYTVPVPGAAWLLTSGLLGLVSAGRRKARI